MPSPPANKTPSRPIKSNVGYAWGKRTKKERRKKRNSGLGGLRRTVRELLLDFKKRKGEEIAVPCISAGTCVGTENLQKNSLQKEYKACEGLMQVFLKIGVFTPEFLYCPCTHTRWNQATVVGCTLGIFSTNNSGKDVKFRNYPVFTCSQKQTGR